RAGERDAAHAQHGSAAVRDRRAGKDAGAATTEVEAAEPEVRPLRPVEVVHLAGEGWQRSRAERRSAAARGAFRNREREAPEWSVERGRCERHAEDQESGKRETTACGVHVAEPSRRASDGESRPAVRTVGYATMDELDP